ncbi:MAG: acetyl-CoA carboxylase carboxyl transferase subunit beta [Halanaerobiales bacterium]|nr:acetyl-CoA carboxylase carboxyl transferase subunit beta [Halanaerobiales bacterium]
MFKDLFGKSKYVTVKTIEKRDKEEVSPDNRLWTKCNSCKEIIFNKKLVENLMVCPKCGYHFRLTAKDRLTITLDQGSFKPFGEDIYSLDPLEFPGYKDKIAKAKAKTGMDEAVIVGEGTIKEHPVIIGVMDFNFMGGSMGSVVGEKITLAIEKALETRKPLIIFSTAGGARMQEGMFSLMQMAKTSAAVKRLHKAGVLFISVMTNPTSGGVTASFASLADIIIGEKGALIAFAGPRVIKQTISADLPEGFQRAEFLLEHGMLDLVVSRDQLRDELARILKIHQAGVVNYGG